jgi:hypothetical protein
MSAEEPSSAFWALSSALLLPPVARAVLDGETDLARRFWEARVRETFFRQARIGRDFHRLVDIDTPFWRARRAFPDDLPAHAEPGGARLERRVVVRGGRLEEGEVLVTPTEPGGVAFVGGHPIVPVVRRRGGAGLPEPRSFAERIMPEAPPEEAEMVRRWLAQRGIPCQDHEEMTMTEGVR